jgi:hypothetical protein
MFFWDLIVAFFIALIISVILGGLLGWERPDRPGIGSALVFLFLILFLATWAGGVWITPFGPAAWGVFWLPFLVVGIIIAFLIVALVPTRRPRTRQEAAQQAEEESENASMLGGLFWFFIILLIIAIIAGYIW